MPPTEGKGGFSHPTVVSRMPIEKIEMMFAHIFRVPEAFTFAINNLRPDLFDAGTEAHYKLLWRVTQELFKRKPQFVSENPLHVHALLELELVAKINDRGNVLSPAYFHKTFSRDPQNPGLLTWIFRHVNVSELKLDWAKELIQEFRLEREVSDPLHKVVNAADGRTIVDLPEFLQGMRDRYVSIRSQRTDYASSGSPENWAPRPLHKFDTGVPFMTKFLGGGHAGGESYGVLGAYGSGKTCLAVQLLAGGAKSELKRAKEDPDYKPKHWFLFTYEAILDEIIVRLWSSEATIDHANLEVFEEAKLTSIANGVDSLHPYEKAAFPNKLACNTIEGEKERLAEARSWMKKNLWIHDMTGTGENPLKGAGYIEEIVDLLHNEVHRLQRELGYEPEVGGVIVDYAGLCANRHIMATGKERSELRHLIGGFGYISKIRIAVPFNCPVWIFHQLDTKAQGRGPAAKAHHVEAAEAHNFAENVSFAFQLGTKDRAHDALFLNCTKARRGETIADPPILHLEGRFYRLVSAKGLKFVKRLGRIGTVEDDLTIGGDGEEEVMAPPPIDPMGNGYDPFS